MQPKNDNESKEDCKPYFLVDVSIKQLIVIIEKTKKNKEVQFIILRILNTAKILIFDVNISTNL